MEAFSDVDGTGMQNRPSEPWFEVEGDIADKVHRLILFLFPRAINDGLQIFRSNASAMLAIM